MGLQDRVPRAVDRIARRPQGLAQGGLRRHGAGRRVPPLRGPRRLGQHARDAEGRGLVPALPRPRVEGRRGAGRALHREDHRRAARRPVAQGRHDGVRARQRLVRVRVPRPAAWPPVRPRGDPAEAVCAQPGAFRQSRSVHRLRAGGQSRGPARREPVPGRRLGAGRRLHGGRPAAAHRLRGLRRR